MSYTTPGATYLLKETVTVDEQQQEVTVGYGIYVNNQSGYALPHTGGEGTTLYTLGGLTLMLGAALMYGFRMRRRRKEVNDSL